MSKIKLNPVKKYMIDQFYSIYC